MRDILPALDEWRRQGEEIAVATVVRVRGASPRPLASRLAVTASGRMAGSVSGGCVETDVFERAQRVLESGSADRVRYDALDEAELGIGLACGGSIDVLIEAFAPGEAWQAVREALEQRRPVVRCTAIDPAPLRGRALAVAADGARSGGIDPIQLGTVAVLATLVGLVTPPVGFLIYLTAAQAQVRAGPVIRELSPFVLALILLLVALVFIPGLSLWLPRLFFG